MRALALLLLASALNACQTIDPPDQFLTVERGFGRLKAVADDEGLYWVRSFADPEQAGFDFWQRVVENEFIERRGYTLIEKRALAAPAGAELLFEVTVSGVARRYLAVIWVESGITGDTIHVIEYVADKDRFDRHLDAVRQAVAAQRE